MLSVRRPVQNATGSYDVLIEGAPGGETPTAELRVDGGTPMELHLTPTATEGVWQATFTLSSEFLSATVTASQAGNIASNGI